MCIWRAPGSVRADPLLRPCTAGSPPAGPQRPHGSEAARSFPAWQALRDPINNRNPEFSVHGPGQKRASMYISMYIYIYICILQVHNTILHIYMYMYTYMRAYMFESSVCTHYVYIFTYACMCVGCWVLGTSACEHIYVHTYIDL